jgi:hypothetical protein
MRRSLISSVVALALVVPALRADVKTTQKSQLKLEGLLGRMMRGAGDPISSTIAVKGPRKISMNPTTGEIVDLAEEKVYRLEVKKKEYKVVTFEQLRKEWQDAQAEMEKNADQMREASGEKPDEPAREMEYVVDVKETGQKKAIAGYDAREVVLTITGKEKGKTLEEGGGYVLTDTAWIGPTIAALDEIRDFDLKYFKAVFGEEGALAMQQMAALFAMFAGSQPMMQKMGAESAKLQGTPLQSTVVLERVKSAEQMKAASAQSGDSGGGGGLSGMLARRMTAGRGGSQQARATVLTMMNEYVTVETSASDADVAIPAGFKEKK